MEEYIYDETKYIKPSDLKYFGELMLKHEFLPEQIKDNIEFTIVFQYLVSLTHRAPEFLQPYEYALGMIKYLEHNKITKQLQKDLETKWVAASLKIAKKDDLFTKQVPWEFMENRPLIRDYFSKPIDYGRQEKSNRPILSSVRF